MCVNAVRHERTKRDSQTQSKSDFNMSRHTAMATTMKSGYLRARTASVAIRKLGGPRRRQQECAAPFICSTDPIAGLISVQVEAADGRNGRLMLSSRHG